VQTLTSVAGGGTVSIAGVYVDRGRVYFSGNTRSGAARNPVPGTGYVWAMPSGGGTAVNLASGLSTVGQIKGDTIEIFVAAGGTGSDGQVLAIDKASGAKRVVVEGIPVSLSLDLDETNVYFGQYRGSQTGPAKVAKTGGPVTQIAPGKPAYWVSLDGTGNVFFTSGLEQGVYLADATTGALVTIESGASYPAQVLGRNGKAIYAVNANCGAAGSFKYGDTEGISLLKENAGCASFFATDGQSLYGSVRPAAGAAEIWRYCLPDSLTLPTP
jgi:hypothetical protein